MKVYSKILQGLSRRIKNKEMFVVMFYDGQDFKGLAFFLIKFEYMSKYNKVALPDEMGEF